MWNCVYYLIYYSRFKIDLMIRLDSATLKYFKIDFKIDLMILM